MGVLLRLERVFAEAVMMTDFYLNVGDEVVQERLVTGQPSRPSPNPAFGQRVVDVVRAQVVAATSSKKNMAAGSVQGWFES